jgi:putative iron-regulated protein
MTTRNTMISMAVSAVLAGCGGSSDGGGSGEAIAELGQQAASTYAQIVYQAYSDSLEMATALQTALAVFVAEPSNPTHEAVKTAWLAAREPYLQTEVFRFYDGPIDNPTDGPESHINNWPLDEAHVDYTRDAADAGIVNHREITIDEATLRDKNGEGGEENISVGFHAIEFLLWGQDDRDPSNELPGQRPFTDFVTDGSGSRENQDRRGEYLALLGDLLVSDLGLLVDAWRPDLPGNYGADFKGGSWEAALEKILTGMIVLSGFETGGERLQPALDNGDQEDEHSCFSDNTHRDMVQDVRGIQNVWLGEYQAVHSADSVSGTGVRDVVAAFDPALAAEITSQIADSMARAEALRPTDSDPPFDVLISLGNTEGNQKGQDLLASLRAQEGLLQDAFRAFGLDVPQP